MAAPAEDVTNPVPAAKSSVRPSPNTPLGSPGITGSSAASRTGLRRPDAEPENPEAREINPFKQALNLFFFGSRDPSYVEIGEFKARWAHKQAVSEALLMAPPGDPARASVVAAMSHQGAQSAMALRERYYAKEYQQMISTQIIPLKDELGEHQQLLKQRVAITNQAVPRLLDPGEGAQLAVSDQMSTPAPDEQVQTGTTAEGKPKTATKPGLAAPTPNPALAPGMAGGTIMDLETLTFMDPITGQPVPVASARGIAIQQEAFDDYGSSQKDVMLRMMDVLASYNGNPKASEALQTMIDETARAAGTAVTGRSSPEAMQEWWENRRQWEADQAGKVQQMEVVQQNQDLLRATSEADARDAAMLYRQDQGMRDLVGKQLGKAIETKGIEGLTEKQRLTLAAMGKLYRTQQATELRQRQEADMVMIPSIRLNQPEGWHAFLRANDGRYKQRLEQRYAEMEAGLIRKVNDIELLEGANRQKAMKELGIPEDIQNMVIQGLAENPQVRNWLRETIVGTKEYEDSRTITYMDRLAEGFIDQPESIEALMSDNTDWIQQYAKRQAELGKPISNEELEYLHTDILGTHIRATEGKSAPDYRPPAQKEAINRFYAKQQAEVKRPEYREQAQEDTYSLDPEQLLRTRKARPAATKLEPSPSEYLQRMDIEIIPDEKLTGDTPPQSMSQRQLSNEIDRLRRLESSPEALRDSKLRNAITQRRLALLEHHINPAEHLLNVIAGGVVDAFTTSPEELKAQEDQRRMQRTEILRHVPKVN